jgi:hypothetical protein
MHWMEKLKKSMWIKIHQQSTNPFYTPQILYIGSCKCNYNDYDCISVDQLHSHGYTQLFTHHLHLTSHVFNKVPKFIPMIFICPPCCSQ